MFVSYVKLYVHVNATLKSLVDIHRVSPNYRDFWDTLYSRAMHVIIVGVNTSWMMPSMHFARTGKWFMLVRMNKIIKGIILTRELISDFLRFELWLCVFIKDWSISM